MMRRRLLLLAILLASCAPKRSEMLLNTDATPSDVLLVRVAERGAKLSSLVGAGTVSFDSPEMSGTAAFESNMKKPDSLLVTLEGPFGIDLGTLFLCKEKYVMYNSLENSVITGTPDGSFIRSVIPFDLTYEQIANAFAGVFTIPYAPKDLESYVVEEDNFLLTYTCGANTCKYWIDPTYLLVTHFEQRDASGNVLVDAKAYAFVQQEDIAAARRVQITFPQQNRQLSIAYRTLKLNAAKTDFRFTIPPNAKNISRP